jgi:hypothetical protein
LHHVLFCACLQVQLWWHTAERHAYMRETKSLPSAERQMEVPCAAGLIALNPERDNAYLDAARRRRMADLVLVERAHAIHACRPGDELWIATPAVLGASVDDALSVLEQVTRRGAVLRIAATGKMFTWHPEAASALALAIGEELRRAKTSTAREAAKAREARTRGEMKRSWDQAKAMWSDLQHTVKAISEATGIKVRTLYNAVERGELPPRQAQPFTGGPKVKRRGKRATDPKRPRADRVVLPAQRLIFSLAKSQDTPCAARWRRCENQYRLAQ